MKGLKGSAEEEIPLQMMQERSIKAKKARNHVKQYVMLTCSVRGMLSLRIVGIISATLSHQGML